jgi:biopolymer transport protein ExbD
VKIHSPIAHKKTRLEIIPLIDVMFFLLASFMMVSLTMTKQQTIKVNLPVAAASQPDFKPDMVNIGVNAAGDVFMDTVPVTLPDLEARLSERFKLDPDTPVYISGDSATPFSEMVKALDAVRRMGFNKVAFNVKPTTGGAGTTPAPAPSAAPQQ